MCDEESACGCGVGWDVGGSFAEHDTFSDSCKEQSVLVYVILTNFKGQW